MTAVNGANPFNPYPLPPVTDVDALQRGDPRALIPCLKQHQPGHIAHYNALLGNHALKNDMYVSNHFAEAVVHASFHLLPEIVEQLLSLPLEYGVRNSEHEVVGKQGIDQFGLEEAIYLALVEGINQRRIDQAERIVVIILEHKEQKHKFEDDKSFLNNSGDGFAPGFLDNSLKRAQGSYPPALVEKLQGYVEVYGVSPDDDIERWFNGLKDCDLESDDGRSLVDDLCNDLMKMRYRLLNKDLFDRILSFAIENGLDDLLEVLLISGSFAEWDPSEEDWVDVLSQAVEHLSLVTIDVLRNGAVEYNNSFHELMKRYWKQEGQNPIITCLKSYVAYGQDEDCPNPVKILEILFKFHDDWENEETEDFMPIDEESEDFESICALKEKMEYRAINHDEAVVKILTKYLNFESSSEDDEETQS